MLAVMLLSQREVINMPGAKTSVGGSVSDLARGEVGREGLMEEE